MDSKSILFRNAFISSCPFDRSYCPCTCIYTVYCEFVHARFMTRDTRYLKYRCDPYRKYGSLSVVKFISKFLFLNTVCKYYYYFIHSHAYPYAYKLHVLLASYTHYYWRPVLLQTLYFRCVCVSVLVLMCKRQQISTWELCRTKNNKSLGTKKNLVL